MKAVSDQVLGCCVFDKSNKIMQHLIGNITIHVWMLGWSRSSSPSTGKELHELAQSLGTWLKYKFGAIVYKSELGQHTFKWIPRQLMERLPRYMRCDIEYLTLTHLFSVGHVTLAKLHLRWTKYSNYIFRVSMITRNLWLSFVYL